MTLRGKRVIVTGGTSGVGRATVVALAAQGARVIAVARGEARLRALAAEVEGVEIVAADVADPGTGERLLRELRPECVVLAAGVHPRMGPFDETAWETFSEAWNVDLASTFHFLKAAIALPLPEGSTIAIVSSGAAINGSFLSGGYAGAKRMQWMLAGYLAKLAESRKLDLRAVAVLPTQLVEGTEIADAASASYGDWLGIGGRAFMDRFEIPLSPAMVADAIIGVLRRDIAADTHAIAVSGRGDRAAPVTTDDARALLPAMADAQARFMALVAELRPELHRYCARMTGSPFDGEDVVQDTLAKACFALAQMAEPPPLRPWLFRIAHNTAMDFVRRYDRTHVDVVADVPEPAPRDEPEADATLVETALDVFLALPPAQRSALALKDVLGHSLEQTAATMGISLAAVKSALVRARANVAAQLTRERPRPPVTDAELAGLRRYADRFNARDWDGLRALLAEDSRLDLVSRWQRRGPDAASYYTRYAETSDVERLRARVGRVGGVPVVAMFRGDAATPAYVVRIGWSGDRIALVRDFRYAAYIVDGVRFEREA